MEAVSQGRPMDGLDIAQGKATLDIGFSVYCLEQKFLDPVLMGLNVL